MKTGERGLRFIEKNDRKKTRCFGEKKTKLALESFAGFPFSLHFVRYFACTVDLKFYSYVMCKIGYFLAVFMIKTSP